MMTTIQDPKATVDVICRWWRKDIAAETGKSRSNRARLRRCDSASEALTIEAVHQLHAQLLDVGCNLKYQPDKLALLVISLANVREDDPRSAAVRFGRDAGSDQANLSATKFEGLIRTHIPGDLIRPLRRALAQIDNKTNVNKLAEDLLFWSEKIRINWCFDYYGNSSASPYKRYSTISPNNTISG